MVYTMTHFNLGAQNFIHLVEYLRNSTNYMISFLASFPPATSLKVTLRSSFLIFLLWTCQLGKFPQTHPHPLLLLPISPTSFQNDSNKNKAGKYTHKLYCPGTIGCVLNRHKMFRFYTKLMLRIFHISLKRLHQPN